MSEAEAHAKALEDALNYARPRYIVSQRIVDTGEHEIRVALTAGHRLDAPTLDAEGFNFTMRETGETRYIVDLVPLPLDGVALAKRVLRMVDELNGPCSP